MLDNVIAKLSAILEVKTGQSSKELKEVLGLINNIEQKSENVGKKLTAAFGGSAEFDKTKASIRGLSDELKKMERTVGAIATINTNATKSFRELRDISNDASASIAKNISAMTKAQTLRNSEARNQLIMQRVRETSAKADLAQINKAERLEAIARAAASRAKRDADAQLAAQREITKETEKTAKAAERAAKVAETRAQRDAKRNESRAAKDAAKEQREIERSLKKQIADIEKYGREVKRAKVDEHAETRRILTLDRQRAQLQGTMLSNANKAATLKAKEAREAERLAEIERKNNRGFFGKLKDGAMGDRDGGGLAGRIGSIALGNVTAMLIYKALGMIGDAMKLVVTEAVEFEKALVNISTLSDQGEASIQKYGEAFTELSKKVSFSRTEIAKAAYETVQSLGAQGRDAEAVIAVTEISSKAAIAGMTDSATAVKAITTVLNSYGLSASKAEEVSDKLFKVVDLGVVSFEQVANNIGKFANTAALAKIPLDEVLAAFSTLTTRGVQADEAANSLNRFMLSVIDASKEQLEVAKQLNIDFSIENLSKKGLAGFMNEIMVATNGNIEALAKLNPNVRASRSAFILAGTGASEFRAQLDQVATSAGTTNAAFEKMMNETGALWDVLKNQLSAAMGDFGRTLLPAVIEGIRSFNETIAGGSEFLTVFDTTIESLYGWFKDISPAVEKAEGFMGRLNTTLGSTIGSGNETAKAIGRITAAVLDVLAIGSNIVLRIALVGGDAVSSVLNSILDGWSSLKGLAATMTGTRQQSISDFWANNKDIKTVGDANFQLSGARAELERLRKEENRQNFAMDLFKSNQARADISAAKARIEGLERRLKTVKAEEKDITYLDKLEQEKESFLRENRQASANEMEKRIAINKATPELNRTGLELQRTLGDLEKVDQAAAKVLRDAIAKGNTKQVVSTIDKLGKAGLNTESLANTLNSRIAAYNQAKGAFDVAAGNGKVELSGGGGGGSGKVDRASDQLDELLRERNVINSLGYGDKYFDVDSMPKRLKEGVQDLIDKEKELAAVQQKAADAKRTNDPAYLQRVKELSGEIAKMYDTYQSNNEKDVLFDSEKAKEYKQNVADIIEKFSALDDLGFAGVNDLPDSIKSAASEFGALNREQVRVQDRLDKLKELVADAPDDQKDAFAGTIAQAERAVKALEDQKKEVRALLGEYKAIGVQAVKILKLTPDFMRLLPDNLDLSNVAGAMEKLRDASIAVAQAEALNDPGKMRAARREQAKASKEMVGVLQELRKLLGQTGLTESQVNEIIIKFTKDAKEEGAKGGPTGLRGAAADVAIIGESVQAAIDGFGEIFEMFGGDPNSKLGRAIKSTSELAGGVTNLAKGIATLNLGTALKGVAGIVKGAVGLFSIGKKTKEQRLAEFKMNQSFAQLTIAIDKLRETILAQTESQENIQERVDAAQAATDVLTAINQIRFGRANVNDFDFLVNKNRKDYANGDDPTNSRLADRFMEGLGTSLLGIRDFGTGREYEVNRARVAKEAARLLDPDGTLGLEAAILSRNFEVLQQLAPQILDMMKDQAGQKDRFDTTTYRGVSDRAQFDETTLGLDSFESMKNFVDLLNSNNINTGALAPFLAQLTGLDPTAEDFEEKRQAIVNEMRKLFDSMGNSVAPGLSLEEIQQLIERTASVSPSTSTDEANADGGADSADAANFSSITATQGNMVIAYLSTIARRVLNIIEVMTGQPMTQGRVNVSAEHMPPSGTATGSGSGEGGVDAPGAGPEVTPGDDIPLNDTPDITPKELPGVPDTDDSGIMVHDMLRGLATKSFTPGVATGSNIEGLRSWIANQGGAMVPPSTMGDTTTIGTFANITVNVSSGSVNSDNAREIGSQVAEGTVPTLRALVSELRRAERAKGIISGTKRTLEIKV